MFFVYDTEAMQTEYDTIEESLLFLQPKMVCTFKSYHSSQNYI